jgi:hypothetical protein
MIEHPCPFYTWLHCLLAEALTPFAQREAEKPPGGAKGGVLTSEALKGPKRADKRKPKAGAC